MQAQNRKPKPREKRRWIAEKKVGPFLFLKVIFSTVAKWCFLVAQNGLIYPIRITLFHSQIKQMSTNLKNNFQIRLILCFLIVYFLILTNKMLSKPTGLMSNPKSSNYNNISDLIGLLRPKVNSDKDHELYQKWGLNYISLKEMLMILIYLMLICQNVEINPGPPDQALTVISYNANGLGDRNKLKRVLSKAGPLVEKDCFLMIQETHLVNTDYLKLVWKQNYLSNCVRTNSAGVMILFNKRFQTKLIHKDSEGRLIIVVVEDGDDKFILVNAYFPNDHRQGIVFADEMYSKILDIQIDYNDHIILCAGDFNVCLNEKDLLNRNSNTHEKILADLIVNNNKVLNINDAYRSIHPEGGYSWNRGSTYSRLDYVFVSREILNNIVDATTDWMFESSDHAAVKIKFKWKNNIIKGPGGIRVNISILKDQGEVHKIRSQLEDMMSQIPSDWNPHMKLEFLKVSIRSILSERIAKIRSELREEITESEDALNRMVNLKIEQLQDQGITESDRNRKLNATNDAILHLGDELTKLRKDLSDSESFKSNAKWHELGEKSNKYFLNLNKTRQRQKLIGEINDGTNYFKGQSEVSEGIKKFYKDLYSKQTLEKQNSDNLYYSECPKLSLEDRKFLEQSLTLENFKLSLDSCKDSAPGPDGIPYEVYKKLWNLAGPIILDSWLHSVKVGILPPSHLESIITLLPKEGKDKLDIKNWRPITLSNCDLKIVTKALANKVAKVLESIVDPSQTAYVPGRSVSDSLRSNFYVKKMCNLSKKDAVLISLDAKKAFDSVDHKYIQDTLIAYGFGPHFVGVFKTLYNQITARIMVNGFVTEAINIERGVKQGDALSCAIFIICIDPLIRNLNKNKQIKQIQHIRTQNGENHSYKAAAYADDVSVICKNDALSIQGVFDEYDKLTKRSGLELNAEKTEILSLKSEISEKFGFKYNKEKYEIESVQKIKICGLYFCSNAEDEYKLNVTDKIEKLNNQIIRWSHYHLTLEGKNLIVKTFGLSQLIYNMQVYEIKDKDLVSIERLIFNFLWSSGEGKKGIDRIKRSIMKNDYSEGGIKVTDVECLNKSLKLRQFIRAGSSKHPISKIQQALTSEGFHNQILMQEYSKINVGEAICKSAQETLNIITDHNRDQYQLDQIPPKILNDVINEVSSINLLTFLKRKRKVFLVCMIKQLNNIGIFTLGELIQGRETEMNHNLKIVMNLIVGAFPKNIIEIANNYNEYTDSNCILSNMQTSNISRTDVSDVTAKQLQFLLKKALKKIDVVDVKKKNRLTEFNDSNILAFRKQCNNVKLRNIYFRLIHNDFFSREKMKRFNMIPDDKCDRCLSVETSKHLLFECVHSSKIWSFYNSIMRFLKNEQDCVINYEDIFKIGPNMANNVVKVKTIQTMIQIERPKNWNMNRYTNIILNLIKTEKYNAIKNGKLHIFTKSWGQIDLFLTLDMNTNRIE